MNNHEELETRSPGPEGLRYRVRYQVLRELETSQSVTQLAQALNATDARLLWHLHQLQADGLVTVSEDGNWRRTSSGTRALQLEPAFGDGQAFAPRVIDDFEDAILEVADGLYGPDVVQAGGEHRTRLSAAEAAEFRDRLLTLIAEYFAPGQGDRSGVKYGLHWMLTPIDLHPLSED